MSEIKGGIEKGASKEEVEQDIDPELVDDREVQETFWDVVLPDVEYDPSQFELPDDYEYEEEVEQE